MQWGNDPSNLFIVRIPGLTRETRKRFFPKRITSEQGLLAKQGGGKPPHTLGLICTRVWKACLGVLKGPLPEGRMRERKREKKKDFDDGVWCSNWHNPSSPGAREDPSSLFFPPFFSFFLFVPANPRPLEIF